LPFSIENRISIAAADVRKNSYRSHLRTVAGQLSLLDEARRRNPDAADAELITEIAASTITELDERPPIDLGLVASYRGIDDIRVEPLAAAGSLTPEPHGLVMRLRQSDSPERRRFSGFHEVAHTYQPGYLEQRLFRCAPTSGLRGRANDPESLSDVAAAELLLPQDHFEPDVFASDFDFASIIALGELYRASIQATAYRYGGFWPEPTLIITLEPGVRKAEEGQIGAEERLRVVSAWSASGQWPFVPRNKSAADDGVLVRAWRGESINEPASLTELGAQGPTHLRVAARAFRFRDQAGRLRTRILAMYRQVGY
jgi:hypothetical protein